MHLLRTVVVSSFVLLTSSMLATEVTAEDAEFIAFSCDVPMVGSDRCGSPDRNVRVGPNKVLDVQVSSIPSNRCVKFIVYHAVENKELVTSKDICANEKASQLWPNLKDEAVDVYMKVKSVGGPFAFDIKGHYIIRTP